MPINPAALCAYLDESFREQQTDGIYILAAAIFEPAAQDHLRELMLWLRGTRRTSKLHWREMDPIQRKQAVEELAAVAGFYVAAVGSPVSPRRQERARAACLTAMVPELHDLGVEQLLAEARAPELNRRDRETVQGARFALVRDVQFRVDHVPGAAEPLLWCADILAGALLASYGGQRTFREILFEQGYEISVSTGC